MYLDEMIQDAISKNNKEREELLKSHTAIASKRQRYNGSGKNCKINISMI